MPVCGNYLFFELPKKIVLNPKDGIYFHPHNTTFFYGFQHYSLFFIYYSILYRLFQYFSLIVEFCVSVKEGLYE